jgi:hypothetical protein
MWKLRYWQPEQTRPTVVEVYDDRGIGDDLQHVIDKEGCTRVEAVRRGHPADPPKKKPPVKAQKIEWTQEKHPRGELWVGRISGRMVADVFKGGVGPEVGSLHYSLYLGGGDDESYVDCSSVESAKRSAQKALNKVVQTLMGG